MKSIMLATLLGLATLSASAVAATPQQEKMKACNAQAAGKAGDERKAFMKECLSASKAEAKTAKTAQQEKMSNCNKEAGEKKLKGAERKKFMSECLKG